MRRRLKLALSILGACGAVAAVLLRATPRPQTLSSAQLSASCGAAAKSVHAHLEAQLRLNHEVLGHAPSQAEIETAIVHQLNYVRGVFYNQFGGDGRLLVFANEELRPKLRSQRETAYGLEMTVDTPKPYPEVPNLEYVDLARKRTMTKASDRATQVDYEIDLQALACDPNSRELPPTVELKLPLDPYLAYWAVAPEKRELRVWRSSNASVNPCADKELADLPSPEYYWYFYNPQADGCAAASDPASFTTGHLALRQVEPLAPMVQLDAKELASKPELSLSLIFGYVVHDQQYVPPQTVAAALKGAVAFVDPQVSQWDESSRQFLWAWNQISEWGEVTSTFFYPENSHLLAVARGRLKSSGQPFLLRAYLGPTDLYGPVPAEHWSESLRAMLSDDVVIYAGHSGLGENMRVSRLLDMQLPLSGVIRRPEYQVIAFLSCYSYTYFDQGVLPAAPFVNARRRADMFLTAGVTVEFGQMSAAILKAVTAAAGGDGRVDLSTQIPAGNFVVHREFTPRPQADSVSMRE